MWNSRTKILLLAVFLVLVVAALRQPEASPNEFASRVTVALTPQQAWQRLSDLSVAHNYVPGVVRTEITTSNSRGLGASRRVYSSETKFINETVTVWNENSGFTLRLHDESDRAPMPFKDASFSYRLAGTAGGETTVHLTLSFVIRGGALGDWLARGVMAKAFQERIDAIAPRLKVFYESEDHSLKGSPSSHNGQP